MPPPPLRDLIKISLCAEGDTSRCGFRAFYCTSELGGDSGVSSQSNVVGSGLGPSIYVDVLMAQSVRAPAGWARRSFHACPPPLQSQAGSWLSWLER